MRQIQRGFVRILKHSFEVAFAALFVLAAIALETKHHHLGIGGVTQLPLWLVIWWEWGLFVGPVCMILGILWPRSETVGYGIERVGLIITGVVWASEIAVLLMYVGSRGATYPLTQALAIILGCAGRIGYIHLVERAAEKRLAIDHERMP